MSVKDFVNKEERKFKEMFGPIKEGSSRADYYRTVYATRIIEKKCRFCKFFEKIKKIMRMRVQ